jgi:hypothetical protein
VIRRQIFIPSQPTARTVVAVTPGPDATVGGRLGALARLDLPPGPAPPRT